LPLSLSLFLSLSLPSCRSQPISSPLDSPLFPSLSLFHGHPVQSNFMRAHCSGPLQQQGFFACTTHVAINCVMAAATVRPLQVNMADLPNTSQRLPLQEECILDALRTLRGLWYYMLSSISKLRRKIIRCPVTAYPSDVEHKCLCRGRIGSHDTAGRTSLSGKVSNYSNVD
jgi:hypothetical protein